MRQADINWLPNHLLKDMPEVKVIYQEKGDYGGYYLNNTIVVVEDKCNQSTIAHEFRHFQQDTKGLLDENPHQWKQIGTYEESIHKYFWKSWQEMDALRFQYKYSKDECTEWWIKKLVMRR